MCGSSPSTPSAVVLRPCSRAFARPSDAASMPTIQTGCTSRLRSALNMRSVPMLPDPISAALTLAMYVSCSAAETARVGAGPRHEMKALEERLHGRTAPSTQTDAGAPATATAGGNLPRRARTGPSATDLQRIPHTNYRPAECVNPERL